MYIAVFTGDKSEGLENIKTVSDVLKLILQLRDEKDSDWGDIAIKYDSKEEFIKDLDSFMGESISSYVVGVDVEENIFEIMHIKYAWVIADRIMTPEN